MTAPLESFSVVVVKAKTRRSDPKIQGMLRDFLDVGVESRCVDLSELKSALCDISVGWVSVLPDDMLVNFKRFADTMSKFLYIAKQNHVLLPHKYADPCDKGMMTSHGDFYTSSNVNSVRGLVVHVSQVRRLIEFSEVVKSVLPECEYGLGKSCADPLGVIYPVEVMEKVGYSDPPP